MTITITFATFEGFTIEDGYEIQPPEEIHIPDLGLERVKQTIANAYALVRQRYETDEVKVSVVDTKIEATTEELKTLVFRIITDGLWHTKPNVPVMATEFRPMSEFKNATESSD